MLITYMLQVTLCLAFFYALYHKALQKETLFQTNRIYLLVSVVMSLILPLIRIYILEQQNAPSFVAAPYVYVGSYLSTMNQVIITPHDKVIPWLSILTSLYVSGILFLSYRIIVSVMAILKMKRSGEKKWLYDQRCVLSSEVRSPFSFFNTVYLPLNHQFSDDEMKEIISHEKTHVLGFHTFDVFFMEIVCIGLWPSPMVYLYRKKLREVHEFLADAEVVKDTPWENYASFLVAQKNEGLQHRLSNQLIYSQLKNRLIMMNKERSFQSAKYKYFGIVPILLMALVIFSFREKAIPDILRSFPNQQTNLTDNILFSDALVQTSPVDSIKPNNDKIVLTITKDKKYYLDNKEIKREKLEETLRKAAARNLQRTIYIHITKDSKAGDIDPDLFFYNLQTKYQIDFRYELIDLNKDKAIYNSRDSLSTTVVIAYAESSKPTEGNQSNAAIDKIEAKDSDRSEVFQFVDEMPRFPGCEEFTKTSKSSDTFFSTSHISPGTIRVTSGGKELKENEDYKVDYATNQIKILNKDFLQPGIPINLSFKDDVRANCANEAMFKYIYSAIKYPQEDRQKGNEGMVVAKFIVEPDGSISNAKIVRGQSPGLNAEIIRVINGMNDLPEKWTPGRKEGIAVPVEFTLPFKFVLQQKEIKQDDQSSKDEVFTYVEEMPSFPDGTQAMYNYIYQHIQYPEKARESEISGQVIVQFVVSKEGDIQNAKVIRGIGGGCDEEALRVVNSMPRWNPGKHLGMFVPVTFTLPIKFVLQSDPSKEKDQQINPISNDKMNWTRTDTSLVFNPETKKDEILVTSISPSVVSNNLQVEFSKNVKSAFIFNDAGTVMWQKDFKTEDDTTQWIDVSKWTSGIYRVKSTSGALKVFSSFVVQH